MLVAKIIDNSLPINSSPTYEISMWTSYTSLTGHGESALKSHAQGKKT